MFDLDKFVELAIKEDIRSGDHTSLATVPENSINTAKLIIKEQGILAGVDIANKIFNKIDDNIEFEQFINDGAPVNKGDIAFIVTGKAQTILKAERLVLNIMQRMSGIATETSKYVEKIKDTQAKVLDTRKTTPLFRYFEKMAVKIGGGENHRMGLYDMIMIKDNHIDFAGSIENAISRVVEYLKINKLNIKIEVEARNIAEVLKILDYKEVSRIMLDNFSTSELNKAIKLIGNKVETESSGNITLDNIREYALTGVDYISVGALTHQIKSLDISLKAQR